MMIQEPISYRAVNTFAARCEPFAARTAAVFKRAVFYLAAYIDNNGVLTPCCSDDDDDDNDDNSVLHSCVLSLRTVVSLVNTP